MEQHAEKLSSLIGKDVTYVDDIYGRNVRQSVKEMGIGDVVLLENVRFSSEEMLTAPVEDLTGRRISSRNCPCFAICTSTTHLAQLTAPKRQSWLFRAP